MPRKGAARAPGRRSGLRSTLGATRADRASQRQPARLRRVSGQLQSTLQFAANCLSLTGVNQRMTSTAVASAASCRTS
jgi:hypothetical protein